MDESDGPTRALVEETWGRQELLRAQLCVSVDESYARALSTAQRWFMDGFVRLGGRFHYAASTLPSGELDVSTRLSKAAPAAASVMLGFVLRREDRLLAPYTTYSAEAWEDMLLGLGRVPFFASLECAANDSGGSPDGAFLDLVASRVDSNGTWLHLSIKGSPDMLVAEPQQMALLGFLRDVADGANPVHGEISWGKDHMRCVYEEARRWRPEDTLPNARRALRGYAWVTIVPEEIGVRLGGLDALRGSGAFVEVERLGAGGFWCRATARPEDFDQAAAERVFEVVAAALPPGAPSMWGVYPPNVLSPRDPAERYPDV